jgi:hypothetical protein
MLHHGDTESTEEYTEKSFGEEPAQQSLSPCAFLRVLRVSVVRSFRKETA